MDQEQFYKVQKALADPKRMEILEKIRDSQGCDGIACGSVLKELSIAQSTFSHHVSELADSDLIHGRKDGKWMMLTVNEETVNQYLEEVKKRILRL